MSPRTSATYQTGRPAAVRVDDFVPHAAAVLLCTAGVLGVGALFDLGILWLGQREASPQWEFMAISNTLDAVPALVLALAIAYAGLVLRRSPSTVGYRLLAVFLLLVGLVSAGLGIVLLTDYLSLSRLVAPESQELLRSTTTKGLLLSGLFSLLLVPTGALGLRRRGRP